MCHPLRSRGNEPAAAPTVLLVRLLRDGNESGRAESELGAAGWQVTRVGSIDDARAALSRVRPCATVIEVARVRAEALDLCRELRALPGGAEQPVVLLTPDYNIEAFEAAAAAGFDDFLSSSFAEGSLTESLSAARALRGGEAQGPEWDAVRAQLGRARRQQLWATRLSALLVHDLKAPLGCIDLLVQGLLRQGLPSAEQRESLVEVRHQTQRLAGMILDLLDIGRAGEGAMRANRVNIDARELCRVVLRDFAELARSKDVSLEAMSFAPALHADPKLLQRALANLVDNALRHVPVGGTVTLVVSPRPGYTEVRVGDNGPGVPAALREAVFDAYQVASSSLAGRGLGLTFCKVAVAAHGGRIWIEDEPGTVVAMALPDAPADAVAPGIATKPRAKLAKYADDLR